MPATSQFRYISIRVCHSKVARGYRGDAEAFLRRVAAIACRRRRRSGGFDQFILNGNTSSELTMCIVPLCTLNNKMKD